LKILEPDNWRCQICDTLSNLQVHHIIYRSHGGADAEGNLIRGSDLFGREWSVLGIQFHFPDSRELRREVQRAEQIEDRAERSDHQSTPLAIASRPLFTALVNNW
jgi:hypothetical protein